MRPLLVLILVLAALAALVFGVLSFLKEPPAQPAAASTAASAPADASQAKQPAGLEKAPAAAHIDRTIDPGRVDDPSVRSSVNASAWVYDNELTGSVLNPQNQPLSGAQVSLSTAYELIFAGDPIDTSQDQTVRTDANGRFSFRNIEPRSKYKLTVKHKDYTLKEVTSVPVGESGPSEEPPILLAQGATLQGHVLDEAGNSVDGATLVLDNLMNDGMNIEPPDRMTATSDRSGAYAFANVPKGQRTLTVSAAGYGTITLSGFNFTGDERLPPRDVKLKVAEMIRGRVVCAGQGIPGANVQAIGFGGSTTQVSRVSTTTDTAGQFTFETLLSGTDYNLIASAKGYRFEQANRVKTGTDSVVIEAFKEADVCGRVIDGASGAAVASFTCRMRTLNGPGMPTSPTELVQAFNSPNGEFCMNGIPAGEYVIEASAPGYAPSFSGTVSVTRGQSPNSSVIKLTHGGTLGGRIVDAAGNPVRGARITTHDKEWSDDDFSLMLGDALPSNATKADVRSGDDGRFLIPGLTPDTYQMHVRAAGYTRYIQNDISVIDGQETKLGDIRLSHGGSLRGTLFDPSGKPLIGGMINVSPEDSRPSVGYSQKSGDGGKFLIANIQPGRYVVTATRGSSGEGNPFEQLTDRQNTQKRVTISDEGTAVVDLTLGP
jgi:hypothetical protein